MRTAVLHGHKQQHAIVNAFAAQLPLVEHPLCVSLDALVANMVDHQHLQLCAGARLQLNACVRSLSRVSAESALAASTTGSSSAGTAAPAITTLGNRHSSINSHAVARCASSCAASSRALPCLDPRMQRLQLCGRLVEHLQIGIHQGRPVRRVPQQLRHLLVRRAIKAFAQHGQIALAEPSGSR
jgi:hypothetical protein